MQKRQFETLVQQVSQEREKEWQTAPFNTQAAFKAFDQIIATLEQISRRSGMDAYRRLRRLLNPDEEIIPLQTELDALLEAIIMLTHSFGANNPPESLNRIFAIYEQLVGQQEENPTEVGVAKSEVAIQSTERISSKERAPIEVFARFVYDARRNFADFLKGHLSADINGDDEESLLEIARFIEKVKNDVDFRVRIFLEVEQFFFAKFEDNNNKNIDGNSWPGVSIPTAVLTEDNFLPLTRDPEHDSPRELEKFVQRFPEPFATFLKNRVALGVGAKIGMSMRLSQIKKLYESKQSRIPIGVYLDDVVPGLEVNPYNMAHIVTSAALDGAIYDTKNKSKEDVQKEKIKLYRTDVYNELIRLAGSLIEDLFMENGAIFLMDPALVDEDAPNERRNRPKEKTNTAKQEFIRDHLKKQYLEYLNSVGLKNRGEQLTTLEDDYVDSAVRWAFSLKRFTGQEIWYDPSCVLTEVAQMYHPRMYHMNEKKAIDGTKAKPNTMATGYLLAQAAFSVEESEMFTVRLPGHALDIAPSARVFFQQMREKYGVTNEELQLKGEFINAVGMFPFNYRDPSTGDLDWSKIDKEFVAVRVKPEFRTLNWPHSYYVLMPATHIDNYNPTTRTVGQYCGLHVSITDLMKLKVKHFDTETPNIPFDRRELVIAGSAGKGVMQTSPADHYVQIFANMMKIYELGNTDKIAKGAFNIVDFGKKVELRRRPSTDIFVELGMEVPGYARRAFGIARTIARGGKPDLSGGSDWLRMDERTFRFTADLRWLRQQLLNELEVVGNISSQFGVAVEAGDKEKHATGLAGLFQSTIKYVIENTMSNASDRTINPDGSENLSQHRSLSGLRRFFRDPMEFMEGIDEDVKLFPPDVTERAQSIYMNDNVHKYIQAWESKVYPEGWNDKNVLFALRMEIMFTILHLVIANFKPKSDAAGRGLDQYQNIQVETLIPGVSPITLDVEKGLRTLIVDYYAFATYTDKSINGPDFLKIFPQYSPKRVRARFDRILEEVGIVGSFEDAVLLMQYLKNKRAQIPEVGVPPKSEKK